MIVTLAGGTYNIYMRHLVILGRQPKLSLAELESLYGADSINPISSKAAIVDADNLNITRLGGSIKVAKVISEQYSLDWDAFFSAIVSSLEPTSGKLSIGLSVYGTNLPARQVFGRALELKKILTQAGHSVRAVPNPEAALGAASVIHNGLISGGAEWLIVSDGKACVVARTLGVQDIEAYGRRDYGRPQRSAKVGMLPPKLAQIMINLANPKPGAIVLDPFCGTGVVLQEAALMGFETYGSDIEPDLLGMTRSNLADQKLRARLVAGDATSLHWEKPIDAVVSEGYLGPPQSSPPSQTQLENLKTDAARLTLSFLGNLASQITSGIPVVMCLPAWRSGKTYERLQIVDQIRDLGYTLMQFQHASQDDLLYFRHDQIVARELLVLRRK